MENQTTNLPPTYTQMLEEMGKHLSKRKGLLAKRVLLITWPFLLLVVIGFVIKSTTDARTLFEQHFVLLAVCFAFYIFLSVIYSTIIKFVLTIEKQIWIDSYFDSRNLEPKDSWRIARKLFWYGVVFRFKIFVHYYLLPIIVMLASVMLSVVYLSLYFKGGNDMVLLFFLLLPVSFLIALAAYSYYLKIKLRYTWFLFLDLFGSAYTFDSAIDQMNKLNAISKSDTFKKSLVANIGTDSVNAIAQLSIRTISKGLSSFGGAGQLLGVAVSIYGQEASRQVTDLGNISAQYLLYRFARKDLFGTEQVVNETIYRL